MVIIFLINIYVCLCLFGEGEDSGGKIYACLTDHRYFFPNFILYIIYKTAAAPYCSGLNWRITYTSLVYKQGILLSRMRHTRSALGALTGEMIDAESSFVLTQASVCMTHFESAKLCEV